VDLFYVTVLAIISIGKGDCESSCDR